jgi:hypothetical protein
MRLRPWRLASRYANALRERGGYRPRRGTTRRRLCSNGMRVAVAERRDGFARREKL